MDTPPFSELGLPDPILAAIQDMGFESPSPIQAKTIPLAMTGKDLVGLSQTGSGKTAAFGLPVLADIDTSLNETQALVVCPTRSTDSCVDLRKAHTSWLEHPGAS